MPILNYTTEINADKTVGELQRILAKAGASRIMIEYVSGDPAALLFELNQRQYRLPCRHEAVLKQLRTDRNVPPSLPQDAF